MIYMNVAIFGYWNSAGRLSRKTGALLDDLYVRSQVKRVVMFFAASSTSFAK